MAEASTTPSTRALDRAGFRPEIQALRALAVLSVVFNHLWPERLGGGFVGVDVFFVISGYLITSHLMREVARTDRIRLGAFWGRRARRLLPASLLVLAAAAIGVAIWIPIAQWAVAFRQILASALYAQNWVLAADSVDYFASGNSASPVTHYWSLSVEEQFYVVWPLLILLALALTRGRRTSLRRPVLAIILGLVVASSLICSIVLTAAEPSAAYFVTPTRAWEFGVGGLLALAPVLRGREVVRGIGGWVGWIAILASTILMSESTPFPGAIALVPVLGTALVIAAGRVSRPWASTRFAGVRPLQFLGDISYSLYLWHWPLVIILPYALGRELSAPLKFGVLIAAVVLAGLTKRFVEDPARTWTPLATAPQRRTAAAAILAMALVTVPAGLVVHDLDQRIVAARATLLERSAAPIDCYGAIALQPGSSCDPGFRLADRDQVLVNATNEGKPVTGGTACQQDPDVGAILVCGFGAPTGSETLRVALVGDSHMGHWIGAIDRIAIQRGWHVDVLVKSACAANLDPLLTAGFYPRGAASCHAWAASVVDRIARADYDLVLTSSISRHYEEMRDTGLVAAKHSRAGLAEGYAQAWQTWLDAGEKVAVVADVPSMTVGDVPNCVARHIDAVDPCTTPADVALPDDTMKAAAAGIDDPAFALVDLSDHFCDRELCHAVIGGVLVYGDADHLTNTYSRTLATELEERLAPLLAG